MRLEIIWNGEKGCDDARAGGEPLKKSAEDRGKQDRGVMHTLILSNRGRIARPCIYNHR